MHQYCTITILLPPTLEARIPFIAVLFVNLVRFGVKYGGLQFCSCDDHGVPWWYEAEDSVLLQQMPAIYSTSIATRIQEEGSKVSVVGVWKFIRRYWQFGTIGRRSGSGHPAKMTPIVETIIDRQLHADNRTTAVQLQNIKHFACVINYS